MPSRAPRSPSSSRPRARRWPRSPRPAPPTSTPRSRSPRGASTTGARGPARAPPSAAGCCSGSPSCSGSAAERVRRRRGPQRGPAHRRRPLGGRARPPTTFEYYAGAANKLFGEVVPVQDAGLDVVLREPVGVVRAHRAVELPAADRHVEGGARARVRQPGHPQARVAHAAHRAAARRDAGGGRRAGRAASRVLPGPGGVVGDALVADRRVDKIVVHRRDRHRRRRSCRRRPTTSPACRSSSAASRRASCSPTPTSSAPPRRRRCRCSPTPARTAAPAAGSWSSARSTTTSSPRSRRHRGASRVGDAARRGDRDRADDLRRPAPDLARLPRHRRDEGAERASPVATCPTGPGCYLTPAVLAGVDNSMRVAREEIFGPVASIIPFDDEADAIRIANDSAYGLSGSLWTGSGPAAIRVAKAIRTGDALGEHEPLRAHRGAVRRVQAVGARPRARHARHGPLHRGQERLLLRGADPRPRRRRS